MQYNRFYPAKKYRFTVIPLSMIKEMLLKRRANERDNIVLITGQRGEGKTTLAGKILFQFEDFEPYEQVIYSKEALLKQIKKKDSYILCDEAVVNAAKGNVMSRANKLLHEILTINRSNRNILFMLIPSVEDFDTKILQYCSMWLFVDSRGYAIMFLPENKGIFGKKAWNLDEMKKLYDEFMKENKQKVRMPYWCFSNFRGSIRFGKLTQQQQKIMDEIKDLRKNENLDKEMQQEVTTEVKDLEQYNKYSAKKISELVIKGEIRSIAQFEQTCKDMKLEPLEMIKKCDSIFKHNNQGVTVKQKIKSYEKLDNLIRF